MTNEVRDLFAAPRSVLPQDIYLMDLLDQCSAMESRVLMIADKLPDEERQIIELYIDLRNEVELYSMRQSMQFGKKCLK